MLKNTFNEVKKFLNSSVYGVTVVSIVFVYFLLYSMLVNFELSIEYASVFFILDHYFIFWILFFDFAVRIIDAIYAKKFYKILTQPGNIIDIAIFISMFSFNEYSYHLIWLRIIRLLYLIHFIDNIHVALLKFRESKFFNYSNTSVILLFAMLVGVQNTYYLDKDITIILNVLDVLFMMYFVFEITIKILSRKKIIDYFYNKNKLNWWNIFDFSIVFVSILPLSELSSVLVVRVVRVLRIFTAVSALKKIIKALQYSISSIGYILLLLTVIFFIYANIGVLFFGHFTYEEGQPNLWKDLPSSLLTLYRVLTFEDWTDVMYQAQVEYPIFGTLYFVSFTALTVFVFLNLFTGVIIQKIQKANSNLLKFKLNDEQSDLEEGIATYDYDHYIVIFNYNDKLPYVLKELDKKANTDKTNENVIIILNDLDKVECFEDGDCFIGQFIHLRVRFVYADILKEETHHRFNIYRAKSVIILNNDYEHSENISSQTIKADNLNIKIFSFLMNNKIFVLNMIYQFLLYERMNCLVEVHTKSTVELVRSIMKETITGFIYLTKIADEKEVYHKLSQDVLLFDKFKTSKKIFRKRMKDNKNYNYERSFSERDFFAIFNQSQSTGQILSNAIQYFMIYKAMLELFSFYEGYIQYIEYKPSLFKKRLNKDKLSFKEAFMLYDNGLLLGYSIKVQGFIKPVINPGPDVEIPEECYLIIYSSDTKIKGRNEFNDQILESFTCEDINRDKHILLIDDKTRPIEINNDPNIIDMYKSPEKLSEYYKDKKLIKNLFVEYDYIIINLEDDKTYNLVILFLETIKENRDTLKDKLIVVFDNNVYAKLLRDSFYKFENSIVSKHLQSLFISQISQNSHTQEIIKQLLFFENANNQFQRIEFDNKNIENFDHLKGGLLEQGYLYLASVRDKSCVTINDDDYKMFSEAIVISNESLIQKAKSSYNK